MNQDHINKKSIILESFICFGIGGLVLYLGLYIFYPLTLKIGWPQAFAFPFFLWIGIFLLVPITIVLYKKETSSQSFSERFRFHKIKSQDIKWIIIGILIVVLSDFVIMDPVQKAMAKIPAFSPPSFFPELLNPLKKIELPLDSLLGIKLKGNWCFLLLMIPLHSVAMFSEEFIWRGYFLPKQEKVFGKWAWLFNGLLWAYGVHFILKWAYIAFLPSMLITSFMAQKTKNTWVSFLIHTIPNTILWIIVLISILK
jgi:membrane protease YdiL (CAAX protease family)